MSKSRALPMELLQPALDRRGWTASALAKAARIHPETASAACSGRPVAVTTAVRIIQALGEHHPDPVLARFYSGTIDSAP